MCTQYIRTKKISKIFGSVGAIALALLCTVIPSFAATREPITGEYNLVNPDISTWSAIPFSDGESALIYSYANYGYDVVQLRYSSTVSGKLNIGGGYYQTIPSGFLMAGRSYTAIFSLPTVAELRYLFGGSSDEAAINSYINACFPSNGNRTLTFGVGTFVYESGDSNFTPFNNQQIVIDKDNVRDYIGKTIKYSFVCPNYTSDTVVINFGTLQTQSSVQGFYYQLVGRYAALIDNDKLDQIDNYNQWFYGGDPDEYTNPFTTENYDVGDASDFDRVDDVFDRWKDGIDSVFRPLRVAGVFSNAIFSPSAIAWGATLVFLLLSFAFLFRLMGVT